MADKQISFKISDKVERKLKAMAKKELRSITAQMRKILTEAVERND